MSLKQLLVLQSPVGGSFSIPYHEFGPKERPARLALVAGLGGNELNGVFVLSRLVALLNDLSTRGEITLHERVLILPAVNLAGLDARSRQWPFDQTDLNRMFPGSEDGETCQRIAAAVLELTSDAYYRIDLHSSNQDIEELPQVRLYEPNDDERASACLFGLPAVVERPLNSLFRATLAYAWRQYGGENFLIQAGQAGQLQTHHCEVLFRALVAFLDRTGIASGLHLSDDEDDLHYFGSDQAFALLASEAGLFVSRLEVGRWVQAGERLGHIYDGLHGHVRAEVLAPVSGLLITLRRQPLIYQGDLVVRILTPKASHHPLDPVLHDQAQ